MKTALVHSDEWRRFDYGPEHPLRMERLGLTWSLMEAYGLTSLPQSRVVTPAPAEIDEIAAFHARDYIEVLRAVDAGDWVPHAARYGLGPGDNPIFPGLWDLARVCAGGSLMAAALVAEGEADRAFHFAGGLHHAMPDRASGFCYVNDPVLAIMALRRRGWRVAYVDIDAHHGDGVQAAFYETDRVLTISLHETGRVLFPGTGFAEERGRGAGAGYSINVELPPNTDGAAYVRAFDAVVPPLLERYRPDVLVTQQGIDSHFDDPLTHLMVSTQAREHVVRYFVSTKWPWAAMGGGGYSLDAVRRAWSMEFLVMQGAPIPPELHDADPPEWTGSRRAAIDAAVDAAITGALDAAWT